MGRYYALNDGEDAAIADAVAEHYSPLGPGDVCPTAPVSVAVALADKLDTLVGFFAIGETPTGSKPVRAPPCARRDPSRTGERIAAAARGGLSGGLEVAASVLGAQD